MCEYSSLSLKEEHRFTILFGNEVFKDNTETWESGTKRRMKMAA
jgi:hypothetical protein